MPIRRSSQGVSVVPASVSSAAVTRLKATAVWIARRIFSSSRAPKKREMTTPAPIETPTKKLMSRKLRLPVALTAASAPLPTKLPTISASATL